MSYAVRKLQGFGLIVLLTLFALGVYAVNLKVSATLSDLRRVNAEIAQLEASKRVIEGDIAVVASARQLDRWNRDYFGLVAPQAQQFVESERVLAQLDTLRPIGPPERSAPALAVAVAQADAERATSADLRRVAMTTIDGPVFR